MNPHERLELLATAKAGHCALALVAESGESDAFLVLHGAIKAFVSAAVSLDYEQTRTLLRELEIQHFHRAPASQNGENNIRIVWARPVAIGAEV